MRRLWKILLRACLTLGALTALVYVGDDLYARFRGKPTEQVKVDIVYADVNHWDEVEYSAGRQEMQTCIDALMPHFGYRPCWYLKRHTLQQVGNP